MSAEAFEEAVRGPWTPVEGRWWLRGMAHIMGHRRVQIEGRLCVPRVFSH